MLVSVASAPSVGRINEDFAVASPEVAVVLDGAGLPSGMDTGCCHGVPWFARTLGIGLFKHAAEREANLTECLADAIDLTAQLHRRTCDLDNLLTPSATVAVARARDGVFEWLVLADSTVVLGLPGGTETISDHRVSEVVDRQRVEMEAELLDLAAAERRAVLASAQRRLMNRAEGYWVAAADPAAAEQGLAGEVALTAVRAAAIVTDGAARAVDDFGVMGWPDLLSRVEADGPRSIIEHTRELERSDPHGQRWPRTKCHDDATAVLMQRGQTVGLGKR